MLRAGIHPYVLQFAFDARTSRGLMRDKRSWIIKIWDESNPQLFGLGECGPLPFLSKESTPEFETVLNKKINDFQNKNLIAPVQLNDIEALDNYFVSNKIDREYSSITFALETALLDLSNGGRRLIFENQFSKTPIPINGLIWMGDVEFMLRQVEKKIEEGFTCLKFKIGGLEFDRECEVLHTIRKKYSAIQIRLDANGAFDSRDALRKLFELSQFQIHSIEQPIKPGLPEMEMICRESPIAIAFDEELIGIESEKKQALLQKLKPQLITLKPTLHGGLCSCAEWIRLAQQQKMGWWITSALESNVGLNAIAQFASQFALDIPQGLGTGEIYTNNFPSPLKMKNGFLYHLHASWRLDSLFFDQK